MSVTLIAAPRRTWIVDWRRVARWTAVGSVFVVAVITLLRDALGGAYALDFRGGISKAGAALLHGRSPYPRADAHVLLSLGHAFVTPPPLAVIGAPFSLLPFGLAAGLWTLLSVSALIGALAVLGIRDARIYLLSISSIPLIDGLSNGQPDCLLLLAAAFAWRYRDSFPGGVAAGALIALKLVAWPLLIWLLVMRRGRAFVVACASAFVFLAGSWALIDFQGLTTYPTLLAADARAFATQNYSYSPAKVLSSVGVSLSASMWLGVLVAAVMAALVVRASGESDLGWFTGALIFGLLAAPILWLHYVPLLFAPMAISRRRSLGIWFFAAYSFWFALVAFGPGAGRACAAIALIAALALWAVSDGDKRALYRKPRPARTSVPMTWSGA